MNIFLSLIIASALIFGAYAFMQNQNNGATPPTPSSASSSPQAPAPAQNVTREGEKQIVSIRAKGGYAPKMSTATAGIPTTLRVTTERTFDCSSQLRIPSLNISEALPPSGTREISLGILKPGMLQGTCGMGMYRFDIIVEG